MTPTEHTVHVEKQQPHLKAFLDNELSPWRRLAVRLHLARCEACREELQAMQQIGKELRGQKIDPLDPMLRARILDTVREMTPDPAPPLHVPVRRPALALGGAALAALLIAVVVMPRYAPELSLSKRVSAPATSSSAAPPAAFEARPETASKSAASIPPSAYQDQERARMRAAESQVAEEKQEAPQDRSANAQAKAPSPQEASKSAADVSMPEQREKGQIGLAAPAGSVPAFGGGNGSYTEAKKAPHYASGSFGSARSSAAPARRRGLPAGLKQPITLERAGFDLQGYQFVTRTGEHIAVPFGKSLNTVRFARAVDGKMALAEDSVSPILYLGPTDALANVSVPDARWQPLPASAAFTQPRYVHPAPTWEQFVALRWYPKMTLVGGLTQSTVGDASFTWLPGSHVRIGDAVYPDFAAYRAYADAHPEALSLRAIYPTPVPSSPAAAPPSASGGRGSAGSAGKPRP